MTQLFIQNKYTKWYYNIINKALSENREKSKSQYFESHHIIPKCIVKNNNTVLLTGREHFIAHVLLCKMCKNKLHKRKMYFALKSISEMNSYEQKKVRYVNSKLYEYFRTQIAKNISKQNKGKPSPFKGIAMSKENKQKLKISLANSSTHKIKARENFQKAAKLNKGKKRPDYIKEICRLNGLLPKSETAKKNMSNSAKERASRKFCCLLCQKEFSTTGLYSHFKHKHKHNIISLSSSCDQQ